jgi:hypothetical protein
MHEPALFWGGLASLPFAIVCFFFALRVESPRAERFLTAFQVIAGVALMLMGYEMAGKASKSIPDRQIDGCATGLLLMAGFVCLFKVIERLFEK